MIILNIFIKVIFSKALISSIDRKIVENIIRAIEKIAIINTIITSSIYPLPLNQYT